jgi:protein O-mannosyl-transferase
MAKKQNISKPQAPKNLQVQSTEPRELLKDFDEEQGVAPDAAASSGIWKMLTKGFVPYALLAVIGLICYASTFNHELALDDDIVIAKNEFVLRGADGIPDIFTHDLFESFYRQMNTVAQLSGGRYRPFSVATFALEQEFIGKATGRRFRSTCWDENGNKAKDIVTEDKNQDRAVNEKDCYAIPPFDMNCWDMNGNGKQDASEDVTKDGAFNDRDCRNRGMGFRHINNVVLYIGSVAILFWFLTSFFFKDNRLLAFLISLMFLAHPIHTEVVANVKSRDEILSFMFMILTLHNMLRYSVLQKKASLGWGALCFFIALMSKEYAAMLLFIVPIAIVGYQRAFSWSRLMPVMVALGGVMGLYLLCRFNVVMVGHSDMQNTELLNNPYKNADDDQIWPSKLAVNIRYLWLLLFPNPLSCDYSYKVIPYRTFANIDVLASVALLIGSAYAMVRCFLKKNWLAFPIAFALLHLLLVNNVIFDIGATMGERLVYHTSFGTTILLCYGAWLLFKKLLPAQSTLYALPLLVIIGLYVAKTMHRAPQWKNDITLHLTDVQTYPESTMLNGNACTRLIELSEMPKNKALETRLLDSAKIYGKKSLELHPEFVNSFLNMGIIMLKQQKMDSARFYWSGVERLYPHHPQLPAMRAALSGDNLTNARNKHSAGDMKGALEELMKAHNSDPANPNIMRDIANFNYSLGNLDQSKKFMNMALRINPADTQMQRLKTVLR